MAINIRKPGKPGKNTQKQSARPRSGQAMDFAAPSKKVPSAPRTVSKTKKVAEAPTEPITLSAVVWRLSIILCTAAVVISLVFASIRGGSVFSGSEKSTATPPPPVSDIDPSQTITGSDITPPPVSDDAANQGGVTINGVPQQ